MLSIVSAIDLENEKDEAVEALVVNFLRRRKDDIQRIREALASQKFEVIATVGHNLRGNGASYGFPPLSVVGEAIEKAALAADAASVREELERLVAELSRIESDRSK